MKFTTTAVIASMVFAAAAAPAPLGQANSNFRQPKNPFRRPGPAPPRKANNNNNNNNVVGAAFFMTNDPAGNFVMASTIARDGTLTTVRAVATGGNGQHNSGAGPDALFSQGALKVGGNNLFVVNPGSNTLSMFKLNARDPANPKLVGTPADTQGEFPVSVAINSAGNMACVLNGGAKNGVACFKPDAVNGLVPLDDTVRDLGINQTTPANGPAGSASHILFNGDGSKLVASVKGVPPAPGFLAVWDVNADGTLSPEFNAISPPAGGALPFGMAVVDGNPNAFVVTDPGVGFDVIDISQINGGVARRAAPAKAAPAKAAPAPPAKGAPAATASTASADAAAASADASADLTADAAAGNSTADATGDAAAAAAAGADTTAIPSLAASNVVASGKSNAVTVDGQVAVCWAAFSKVTNTFFMTDIGTATVTEVAVDPKTLQAKIVKQYAQTAGSATIDDAVASIAGRDFLYVLAANATSVDVLSLPAAGKAKNIQNVSFAKAAKKIGVNLSADNIQGMTVFIPA